MKLKEISAHLNGVPFIGPQEGAFLYNFILNNKPKESLELGFAYGASSCYIAAALDEIGSGRLTTVDLLPANSWQKDSIDNLLKKTGLGEYVNVHREKTSYNWFLKKRIEERSQGNVCSTIYDFCFIDGSKNWTIDGFAFILADKLLNENGTILFDDIDWTYGSSGRNLTDGINHMEFGEDELKIPHLERIFKLIVMQHPNYSEFKIQESRWAWAKKIKSDTKTIVLEEFDFNKVSIPARMNHYAKRLMKRLNNSLR